MNKKWIAVADATRARIIEVNGYDTREIHTLAHPESRLHPGDLRTGGEGAVKESTNASSHQPEPETTTAERQGNTFAKQVAEYLKGARTQHKIGALVLVAEPAFLGRLRDKMDTTTRQLVEAEIAKDWTGQTPDEIRERVNETFYKG